MRTNDLFRDLLDGLIPTPARDNHMHGPIIVTDQARIERGEYFKYIYCFNGCGLAINAAVREEERQARERAISQASDGILSMAEAMGLVGAAAQDAAVTVQQLTNTFRESPADPRARALAHQQHRGAGPTPEPLRTRGRNNHYRTKG